MSPQRIYQAVGKLVLALLGVLLVFFLIGLLPPFETWNPVVAILSFAAMLAVGVLVTYRNAVRRSDGPSPSESIGKVLIKAVLVVGALLAVHALLTSM
jgi:hypothetical protein